MHTTAKALTSVTTRLRKLASDQNDSYTSGGSTALLRDPLQDAFVLLPATTCLSQPIVSQGQLPLLRTDQILQRLQRGRGVAVERNYDLLSDLLLLVAGHSVFGLWR